MLEARRAPREKIRAFGPSHSAGLRMEGTQSDRRPRGLRMARPVVFHPRPR